MKNYFPDKQNLIWNRVKSGDRKAFQQLYEMHFKDLLSYGLYIYQHEEIVEDAIHDVFVNLYNYRKKLADSVNIKHYLFSCMRRQLLKAKKSRIWSTDNLEVFDHIPNSDECKEVFLINKESDEQVFKALKKEFKLLTEHQKEVIYLRFVQELKYEEIAQVMGISVNSSRTLLYRSIKQLRLKLSNIELDPIPNIHFPGFKKAIFITILVIYLSNILLF